MVGRVTEVQQKRWKVDINCRLDGGDIINSHSYILRYQFFHQVKFFLEVLQLSAVNLPGGEHRRRSVEDELSMRTYLQEGDLISAEVQNIYSDGAVSLHTRYIFVKFPFSLVTRTFFQEPSPNANLNNFKLRSLKYGKLSQGTLLRVS